MSGYRLVCTLVQECSVCGGSLSSPDLRDAVIELALFGAKNYFNCPACGNKVDKKRASSEAWVRKLDKWFAERMAEETAYDLGEPRDFPDSFGEDEFERGRR